jgi:DNA-binding NarL/FixJ family response regulator
VCALGSERRPEVRSAPFQQPSRVLPALLTESVVVNQLSDPPLTSTPQAALTKRQREIMALVAEGLTNQAIADRLGLERLTVSEHVATIIWQLGLQGRHEIAAWDVAQRRRR